MISGKNMTFQFLKFVVFVVIVQSPSRAWLLATLWTVACQTSLSFTISRSFLKLTSVESVMPSSHLILCCPVFSCPQSFPASESFPMCPLFISCGQSIGASASVSVPPMNIQNWFPWRLTGLKPLLSRGLARVFSSTTIKKHQFLRSHRVRHDWGDLAAAAAFFMVQFLHQYMTSGEAIALTMQAFVSKAMSLLFNMLSRFVIVLLPRSKCLLILWPAVCSDFEAQGMKISHSSHFLPICFPWSDGTRCHDLWFFECWILSQLFPLLFHLHQEAL